MTHEDKLMQSILNGIEEMDDDKKTEFITEMATLMILCMTNKFGRKFTVGFLQGAIKTTELPLTPEKKSH